MPGSTEPTAPGRIYRHYVTDIQEGTVVGHCAIRMFSYSDTIGTTEQDVWPDASTIVYPTAAGTLSVVSDSINDAAAGSGARTVRIEGLDENFDQITEDVTMNGLPPVVTTEQFRRVNHFFVTTAGGEVSNDGRITVTESGNLQSVIQPEEGVALVSHYTTPRNTSLYVHFARARFDDSGLLLKTKARVIGVTPFLVRNRIGISNASVDERTDGFIRIGQKTDIKFTASRATGPSSAQVDVVVEGVLIFYKEGEVPA